VSNFVNLFGQMLTRMLTQRESVIALIGVSLVATGRVNSWEEATATAAVIGPFILGRSAVKAVSTPAQLKNPRV
jgi:hypothetical protein